MRIASLAAALLLAGCGTAPAPTDMASPSPDPVPEASASPTPARYIGRWAADPKLCKGGAWKFAVMDLSTAGEVSCDFHKVRRTAEGYEAEATCFAEGTRTDETIRMRFADARDAMTVDSKTFRGIALKRCR
ncbi:MAG: hypothetical protein EOP59_01810 [Sphingomonadales bacterium]|nr:MAG: hypothetical protein EOP59_01810 [Sphingomonadales bacterium]